MLSLDRFELKSKTPSKNSRQEWWTFVHPSGKVEVVLRNWRGGSPILQGNKYFINKLMIEGLANSPCTINDEFLKKYYVDVDKAQTQLVKRRPNSINFSS